MNWERFRYDRTFAGLDDQDLLALGSLARQVSFASGESIMVAEQTGDAFYLILSGKVEAWVEKYGVRQSIAMLGPGQIVGERAMLYPDAHRIANVSAVEQTDLMEIRYADFRSLEQSHPHTYHIFLHDLAQLADARTWTGPLDVMFNHYLSLFSTK